MSDSIIAHQPLHPSIIPRLHPDYVAFHNQVVQYIIPPHTLPWDPSFRNKPTVPGSTDPIQVGKTQDYHLTHVKIRTFTPQNDPPTDGWPVFIYFHGGGWTFGNIRAEESFSTNICVRANCVVISVDYRLAPEHPYPAAIEDAIESLHWVLNNGKANLNINTSKIAVGGSSSGGNIAAILSLKAVQSTPPIPLLLQLLFVPVIDNTASESDRWAENIHAPWLSPARMIWFKHNYLPNKEDWTKWDASPIFAPKELVRNVARAWIGVSEVDILKEEGLQYGEMLKSEGVKVEMVVYEKAPHTAVAMDRFSKSVAKWCRTQFRFW
ncbi:hypothetical protein L208DRAFT_1372681 [Tricholoma matsutake]|nr:hypothetical protein L208DRAFT_1372681 [Tricholoma matsutake 945]